jgi:CRP-like cAMP-binding protein
MLSREVYAAQLISHFRELIPLDDAEAAIIIPRLEIEKVARKACLLQPGQVSRHMRFIVSGSMRAYYIDEKSQQHTLQLGIENWWINDLYSYLSGKPSRMFLEAGESTVLVQISKKNLEQLYREIPALSDFFRMKMQSAYVALQERTIENMSVDAYTRYQVFVKDYRELEQRFPQYVIASYLGITPEFLSYLRNKHRSDRS